MLIDTDSDQSCEAMIYNSFPLSCTFKTGDSHIAMVEISIAIQDTFIQMQVVLKGFKNPRSSTPITPWLIEAYPYDKDDGINSGGYFDESVRTEDYGVITLGPIERGSETNSEITDYTFELTTTLPIKNGDYIRFYLPNEIELIKD